MLWPTLQAFQYSATDWNGLSADFNWVGLGNYENLATNDSVFRKAFGNSISFMLVVVIGQTILSLALALALLRSSRISILLRALFFFPTVLSSVSVAFIWSFIYDPNFGLANRALAAVGLGSLQQPWLGDQQMAIFYLAIVQIWFHSGQMMVVYIAGLQQIPQELYDAVALDGAGRWQTFRYLTFPLVQPATVIVVAYTTIQSFKAFDLIIASTGGGPNNATQILATLIYQTAFRNFEMGYAAAQSVIFMVVIAVITILQRKAVSLASGGSDR
ncbi:carbohydrate ABC transporter permease [Brachybacterium aquaticum]|uniref:Raffinose/stachyose/melibiose transport system permease protein n=1 Tax=Brachybacterium aquaticum TaxID=1432564 RepID=A0A841AC09_9MICO|nr:sugar ABC transporter permease [Brachybacterium aquaticum]MBB5832366.1 raffinose/stachyose/melibiose transport system permease protein [Brachybacterium aquaticum]